MRQNRPRCSETSHTPGAGSARLYRDRRRGLPMMDALTLCIRTASISPTHPSTHGRTMSCLGALQSAGGPCSSSVGEVHALLLHPVGEVLGRVADGAADADEAGADERRAPLFQGVWLDAQSFGD